MTFAAHKPRATTKPLPCPFCGSAKVKVDWQTAMTVCATCRSCGASGPVVTIPPRMPVKYEDLDELIDAMFEAAAGGWNRRAG